MTVKIHYFAVRGRAEAMKLALSAAHQPFEAVDADWHLMKTDTNAYPFGQAPRYTDESVDLVQSNSILRYLARKHHLNGSNETEACTVDMIQEGVESLRVKYLNLIYTDKLDPTAKETYWKTHFDRATAAERNSGAHLAYLANFLTKSGSGFMVGHSLTMADLVVFDIVDLNLRILGDEMKAAYPDFVQHHEKVAQLPGIKEYLAGPQRVAKINGNDLG